MVVGIPKEVKIEEYRVSMVPSGIRALKEGNHRVLVQKGAGEGSGISDEEFRLAGAEIIDDPAEVYGRAEMIVKVKEPLPQEYSLLRPGQIVYAYFHLAPAPELTAVLLERKVAAVAYETIQLADGSLPLLAPMSEVAGRMAVQVGAHFLEKTQGGSGLLLGGIPGVEQAAVAILGTGVVGMAATKVAVGMGAGVIVLGRNAHKLGYLDDLYRGRVITLVLNGEALADSVRRADIVVGALMSPGALAPKLVTRGMVAAMKKGSVVVDVSIDQGGCFETSRPTSHRDPVFVEEGVIHYCVANIPGAVARTSTFGLANATVSYGLKLANLGLREAVRRDPVLAGGVNVYGGFVTHPAVARDLGYHYCDLLSIIDGNP